MFRAAKNIALIGFCLTWCLSTGIVEAQEKKKDAADSAKSYERTMHDSLRDIINHGADLYNGGDWNGCYRLWEGTLMTMRPLLGGHAELQQAIDTALTNARKDAFLYRRAWVLRTVLDQIRAELKGETPRGKEKIATSEKTTTEKNAVTPKPNANTDTLWGRLGGEAGVTKLVDDFMNHATRDPKVDFFRHGKVKLDGAQIEKMKREMVEQVSAATGGPLKYDGPDMKKIHKDMGITNAQFDAVTADLKMTLETNKVAEGDRKRILDAMNGYRKDVVQPNKTEK